MSSIYDIYSTLLNPSHGQYTISKLKAIEPRGASIYNGHIGVVHGQASSRQRRVTFTITIIVLPLSRSYYYLFHFYYPLGCVPRFSRPADPSTATVPATNLAWLYSWDEPMPLLLRCSAVITASQTCSHIDWPLPGVALGTPQYFPEEHSYVFYIMHVVTFLHTCICF